MYSISGLCPRTDISMGHHGFCVSLHPEFRNCVNRSLIDQVGVDRVIKDNEADWLKACGYGVEIHRFCLRAKWGEWGPEHISVPGNACGLDIDRSAFGCVFRDGVNLLPHNIDCWPQKQLILIMFTTFADLVLWMGHEDLQSSKKSDQ